MSELTPKQERFIELYLSDANMNSAKAAREAGFKAKNAGSKMLAHPVVSKEISRRIELRSIDAQVSSENVLKELMAIGFVNLKDYMHEDGTYKLPSELTREQMAAVEQVHQAYDPELGKRIVLGYTFYDKTWGLEKLMAHLGMLDERLDVNHKFDPETFISGILQRANEAEEGNVIDGTVIAARIGAA